MKYLNPEELRDLLSVIKNPRDRAIWVLAVGRGLRVSEVGLLQMRNLRIQARRIYVGRLKAGHSGEYHLVDDEVRALRAWLRIRGTAPGPLFVSRKGRAISRQRLDELMRSYGEAAGLPEDKRHFHVLRHTCATLLLSEMGLDIAEVRDHVGHADIRSTQIYAQITSRRRQEIGQRLSREWRLAA